MDLSEKLIALYLPKGVKVRWRSDSEWRPAWVDENENGKFEMLSPYPDTPFKSLTFLHECAHLASGAFRHDQARHIEEYNAERTAMAWWRNEGFTVPRKYLAEAKRYVRECIRYDRKHGTKIVSHIARWAKK